MVADLRENAANIPRKLLAAIALLVAGVALALFARGFLFGLAGVMIGYGLVLALDVLVQWGER